MIQEVIIDFRFAFVTLRKRNRVERSPVARDSSKNSAQVPQEHQIRMRSDERNNKKIEILTEVLFCVAYLII